MCIFEFHRTIDIDHARIPHCQAQDWPTEPIGCYKVKSECWLYDADGGTEDCNSDDTLFISRLDSANFEIIINSYQANGHQCHVKGKGFIENGKLVMPETLMHGFNTADPEKGITIQQFDNSIRIDYLKKNKGPEDKYCGARAILTATHFSQDDKKTGKEAAECIQSAKTNW